MTLGEIKQIKALLGDFGSVGRRLPMPIGENVFIRTITHHYVGKIVAVSDEEVTLTACSWIADDGRFHEMLASGKFNEVEPYPADALVTINRGAFCDWTPWKHELPKAAK